MNGLPLHLLDVILFKLDPKSLTMMRCTNKSINSHISGCPYFEIGYPFKRKSFLFYMSCRNVNDDNYHNHIYCLLFESSRKVISLGHQVYRFGKRCYLLGCCSGLLLVYIGGLFVVNPLTKRFRLLDHSGSKILSEIVDTPIVRTERGTSVGFVVNRNGTTKRFKIVCILEMQTTYGFEMSDGDSWRLSKTTITASSKSDLTVGMKSVYLDDTLHWLRNDGSIVAFNPETEQARFIPSIFQQEPEMKLFLASDDNTNRLTLISGTREEISFYTLLENLNWGLVRRIKNVYMDERELEFWNVVAFNGKRLVVREKKTEEDADLHLYDMDGNSWGVLGATYRWVESDTDFYKYKPSLFFVEEDERKKVIVAPNDPRISILTKGMSIYLVELLATRK